NRLDLNKRPENFFRIAKLVNVRSHEATQHKRIAVEVEKLRRTLTSTPPLLDANVPSTDVKAIN
ncbi:MAG: hypothetical protein ACXWKG_03230, partial [Limisphaerales bacterium]